MDDGGETEMSSYFASAEALKRAAVALDDAEWDFWGSCPLQISLDDEDEDDEWEPAAVLSALGRWGALLEARGLALFVDEMRFIPHVEYEGMGPNGFSIVLDGD